MKTAFPELFRSSRHKPGVRLVRRSALLTLALLGIYALLSFYYLTSQQAGMTQVSEVYNRKVELIHQMSNIVQARSLFMYTVVLNDDPWFRDQQFMLFRDAAVDFIRLRDDFIALGLTEPEQVIFRQALEIIRTTAPLQEDIMQRMQGGVDGTEVWSDIIEKDLPMEIELLGLFERLTAEIQSNADAARLRSEQRHASALRVLALVTLLIGLSVLLGAARVLVRLRNFEASLSEEKELAVGTLDNVVDGVIVTDATGRVLSMNRAAAQLTGMRQESALGKFVDEVYRLGHPGDPPVIPGSEFADMLQGAAMRVHRQEYLQSRDGELRHIEETVSPIFDHAGRRVRVSYIFRDVSADIARMEQMVWEASHDHLTGALNRRAFEAQLEKAFMETDADTEHTLLYLDMDDFKRINDAYGHHAGDAYLINLVRAIGGCIRRQDILARLGGDEFAVLLRSCGLHHARPIVDNLARTISELDFMFEGRRLGPLGVSVGMVGVGMNDRNLLNVMRKVDEACYQAKREGKNRICLGE